ncbi:MAG TPA: 50S ribosomal protein L18 [Candidatus Methanoculleus thermohydrogenotrophicum]|nr:50S ribosomal protein L18 [Candidatus Methanoculleus thermohydrogenotrophicum]NLM81695.1 50S ribosomal protein L18 [Candidatus Methanoculleus thermohydrogenotrophicum]HOB17835.1 50S ribosomal protein L18 [Candidatus Methanoculleus thermohydrogenotrophicum]HPZ37394.1 50S ribosomal protein L18 [Candidatus Methanoculleus thermohydrogenotrophicum]HQC91266.1 50S ribosomal protein L18 [Candidatus Methanoculleus thermohydrogenotrophicum]
MATGPRYFVPFRRRHEGKTDYYKRTSLLSSGIPRMVVRRTNRQIITQLVVPGDEGDRTLVAAYSTELAKYGYEGSTSSTPAAYLTGMLFAVRALNAGYDRGILDIGLARAKPGARVFAALKGAVDVGLDIPYGESILPDEERLKGAHIAGYAPERAENLAANVEAVALAIKKELV